MTVKNVKISLNRISKKISQTQDEREYALKNTRDVIILCSKSIISTHKNDSKNAKMNLDKAGKLLKKYKKKSSTEIQRYFITAEQEYVEAYSLISIAEKKEIPSNQKLQVMPESYVLGLMDCIGELKRMIFDKIRVGEVYDAMRIFDIMENLFLILYPFSMYDKVVKESRRKMDVNRILVDDVRAIITEENRRMELIKTINGLIKEQKMYAGDGI